LRLAITFVATSVVTSCYLPRPLPKELQALQNTQAATIKDAEIATCPETLVGAKQFYFGGKEREENLCLIVVGSFQNVPGYEHRIPVPKGTNFTPKTFSYMNGIDADAYQLLVEFPTLTQSRKVFVDSYVSQELLGIQLDKRHP
jgi:hypothetical protein